MSWCWAGLHKRNDGTSGFCSLRKDTSWRMAIYSNCLVHQPLTCWWQCLATYIWQYILDGVGAAMNGGFWQYAALQFYLQPMHTNQVAAGTIKLCFDTIATSSQILHHEYKLLRIARICKEICRGGGLFKLLHLIIKYLTPSTMHCNVTAGYKCNSN